jgi:hypothetical protein
VKKLMARDPVEMNKKFDPGKANENNLIKKG